MTTERHEIWKIADSLQMDLRAATAKLVELRARLAAINLPEPTTVQCKCGLRFKGPRTLAEHQHVSHGAPLPDHWTHADALAAGPDGDGRARVSPGPGEAS